MVVPVFLAMLFIAMPAPANADLQGDIGNRLSSVAGDLGAGLGNTDIRIAIAIAVRAVLAFIGVIFLVMMVYAGFLWLTSGGNEMTTAKAIHTMQNAALGLLVIFVSFAISTFIIRGLQRASIGSDGSTTYGAGCVGGVEGPGAQNNWYAGCDTYTN